MKNLHTINPHLELCFERAIDVETGEILDEEMYKEFQRLLTEKDDLIEQAALAIHNERANLEAVDKELIRLQRMYDAGEARIDRLKESLMTALNGEKFKTPLVSIYYRTSESTSIDDMSKIPEEFLKYADPEPKKTEIKKAIKDGKKVPGASLVEKTSIIVR